MLMGYPEGDSSERPDCVAGHVRLELRNVAAKYPFERSHGFPGAAELRPQRLFAFDLLREGKRSWGLMPGSQQKCLRGGRSIAEGQELP